MAEASRRAGWGRLRRWLFVLVALVLVLIGALAWYASDAARVVTLFAEVLRRDLGLALTHAPEPEVSLFPSLRVELRDYRIDVVATGRPLAWGSALELEIPWRALRADTLLIERVVLEAPVFHAAGLEGWTLRRAGDAAPPRWPRVAGGVLVRDAKYISSGAPSRVFEHIDLAISPIEAGRELVADASWTRDANAPALDLDLTGATRNTDDGLALDDALIVLSERNGPALRFAGKLRYADTTRYAIEGRGEAERVPSVIASLVAATDPQPPTQFTLALTADSTHWRLVANGAVAGAALDADLRIAALPDLSRPLPELFATLERDVSGHFRIARLRVGDIAFDNFEITGDEAPAPQQ